LSLQRRRRASGTSRVMLRAKAAGRGGRRDPPAGKLERFNRFLVVDLDSHLGRDPGHRLRHGAAAANRVVDAVLVLEEREDRKQARTAERRHPEIFRLKREGQPDPLVTEKRAQFRVQAPPRLQERHQLEQVGSRQVTPRLERLLQEGREPRKLLPVRLHESREGARVGRREPGHLGLHPGNIGGREQLPARAEHQPILRVESHHLDLLSEIAAAGGEDLFEDPRIEEERRPQVELEALGRGDRAGPAARYGQPFDHPDAGPRVCQEHGTGKPAWPGSDDVDRPRHPQLSAAEAAP